MSSDEVNGTVKAQRVLLIGANGNFGGRLARLLAREPGIGLLLAGRRRPPIEALARELGTGESVVLDRASLDAEALRRCGATVVVDASGPFQSMGLGVPEAAIAAGCHYIDLADSRDFVASISQLDPEAKRAGVAVISGASSTPALSNAVLDELARGWRRVDSILVGISPSNRQSRGRAVMEAILAGVGQSFPLFRDARHDTGHGWGSLRREAFPRVGRRWTSLCEVPDNDLLVSRFRPHVSAEFVASLELSIMHLGLWALGGLVRLRLMRSLVPLVPVLGWIADRLQGFGNDMGSMIVRVKGQDAEGMSASHHWWLAAKGDVGPNVPTLAALALVRRLRDGTLGFTGAAPCAGFLQLDEFLVDTERLGMETGTITAPAPKPAFETALGEDFRTLPAVTQAIHRPNPALVWRGKGSAEAGSNPVSRLIGRVFGLPIAARNADLHVVIDQREDGTEDWARVWPGAIMRSAMASPGPGNGRIEERFGPLAFILQMAAHETGIDMRIAGGRLLGIPLPLFLLPRTNATERADGNRHLFDVSVDLPLLGRLVRYHGWLAPKG